LSRRKVVSSEEDIVTRTEGNNCITYREDARKPHKAPDGMTYKRDLKDPSAVYAMTCLEPEVGG
jgi:hypothetical protein